MKKVNEFREEKPENCALAYITDLSCYKYGSLISARAGRNGSPLTTVAAAREIKGTRIRKNLCETDCRPEQMSRICAVPL